MNKAIVLEESDLHYLEKYQVVNVVEFDKKFNAYICKSNNDDGDDFEQLVPKSHLKFINDLEVEFEKVNV